MKYSTLMYSLFFIVASTALTSGANASTATAYDNFGGVPFEATAGWNISGPGVFAEHPILQGEQFIAQTSGTLSAISIAGGWGKPYQEDDALPGRELTINFSPVGEDGLPNFSGGVSISINSADVMDWQLNGIVRAGELEPTSIFIEQGRAYDLWAGVTGNNIFTWTNNNQGDTGPHLYSTEYGNPGLGYGEGVRGAFLVEVSPVPAPAGLGLLLTGLLSVAAFSRRKLRLNSDRDSSDAPKVSNAD